MNGSSQEKDFLTGNMVAAFCKWVGTESNSEEVVEHVEEAALASVSSSPSY